jgi:hypothetical protein
MHVLSGYYEVHLGCGIEKLPETQTMQDVMRNLEDWNGNDSAAPAWKREGCGQ